MAAVKSLACMKGESRVVPYTYNLRKLCDYDVLVDISHCGVCHSDVHAVDNDWKMPQRRPMVPGHEIVGIVKRAGPKAIWKVGDRVGVGPNVGSCLKCGACDKGETQYCSKGVDVYHGVHPETQEKCYGGFAESIMVDSRWAYLIPPSLPSSTAAPLLCAGATVYSPIKRYSKPGDRIGIVGIGGLGHLAIQYGAAMGRKVTAISTSDDKKPFAEKLGATSFLNSKDADQMKAARGSLDMILITISASFPMGAYMSLLTFDGKVALVGLPPEKEIKVNPFQLLFKRLAVVGSALASPEEYKEMLEIAATHKIEALITELPMTEANTALQRVREGKPRFRDVLVQNLGTSKL
eukprot:TRINITY_DN16303_c0_g1_i1.p1 TRINITY_DN16303_c0_g1~~TRINITY_DN16303_c0_g1_i1.p1  ORF type:complete len:361 (+),score=109.86 TRINITY_DN16303_c0_g1_i1:31-1083(+)